MANPGVAFRLGPGRAAALLAIAIVTGGTLGVAEVALGPPALGPTGLRIVTPTLLEVQVVVRGAELPALPPAEALRVSVDRATVGVARAGSKRRVAYAPLRSADLRVSVWYLLELREPLAAGVQVRVQSAAGAGPALDVTAAFAPDRVGPALHVSATGYLAGWPKRGFVGYYAGTLGEVPAPAGRDFAVEPAAGGAAVLQGHLTPRPDHGMPGAGYAQVLEADFSALRTPGRYRLRVPGLGVTPGFEVGDAPAALLARAYALGLYHQRCGVALELPFTRFVHPACHLAPAAVASAGSPAERRLAAGAQASRNPHQTAPLLAQLSAALFPALQQTLDVSGGHHDAGDYGKYAIDSALLVHALVTAVDALPGVAALDNLGLPESGDRQADLLQIALREASFLEKLQDVDGGFFFLVQPRDRPYEDDVTPERGDPQILYPKNSTASAAAVAALAQVGSSPALRAQFPLQAARCLNAARRGWAFLERARARHGSSGAYQRVTHYGDTFEDRDELAWAATEMFLATGDASAHARLLAEFDPASPATRRWGWQRLFEGYGAAIRSYALASLCGRATGRALDPRHLARCQAELAAGAREQADAAAASAYGVSYPDAAKRGLRAGWFFAEDAVFDLVMARRLSGAPGYADAISSNLAYAGGANPLDLTFVTGLGPRRPLEIVHAVAVNDARALPPSGIPVGNLQQGPPSLPAHATAPRTLSWPADDGAAPYAFYDRWTDTFNTTTEATIVNQGRALAALAGLMAEGALARQPWRAAAARIIASPAALRAGTPLELRLQVAGLEPANAIVVWEATGTVPRLAPTLRLVPEPGALEVEAEAVWPDGRRVFAATRLVVTPLGGSQP